MGVEDPVGQVRLGRGPAGHEVRLSDERSGAAAADRSRSEVERAVRENWGRILAILCGQLRDIDLAEDALQDAAVAALQHWPDGGVPAEPRAWLLQTARNRAIDRLRRDARWRDRREELERRLAGESYPELDVEATRGDERMSLIFTCCHPALDEPSRVALTLRTLGGLNTMEIARAFLVPEATLAQRLVRAKRKIRTAGIPYRVPPPHLWPERLESVLSVVYFIFNEGYSATCGPAPTRADLCEEALRLGTILVEAAPDEPEAAGLLALMLLHDSRRPARAGTDGRLITLEEQDRRLWNRERIESGTRLLERALAMRRPGPYQVQAAISGVHARSASHATTDWREITLLYRKLYELQPSPVVRLNEIVALSFAEGAHAGLTALAQIERFPVLERYQPYHAARADLLRRAGRHAEAAAAYRRAIDLSENAAEKAFLARRLRELPG
jgi:RNA polymerase sigma-70 factor (ECF subfamily)